MVAARPTHPRCGDRVTRAIFIAVPSLHPTGPVKGAIALANALCERRNVTLLSLKPGPGADAIIAPRVQVVRLYEAGGWPRHIATYRRLLRVAGGRSGAASISFCFSADVVNLLCRSDALICSSVRGNLPRNYAFDYGPFGRTLARMHLALLRGMDVIVAMTSSMATQLEAHVGRPPAVIGNFVDERALEPYREHEPRSGPYRFVFVGSLGRRKRPDLAVRAIAVLKERGLDANLEVIGSGPLTAHLQGQTVRLGIGDRVHFAGYMADPYRILAEADCLVLPSHSEGVSRALLEALFLGVPCVARNIDGIGEVICDGKNGFLFDDDEDLTDAMTRAAQLARTQSSRISLLPAAYAQAPSAMQYLALVEA